MMFSLVFVFLRIMQIITLIPAMGMLAWFVDGFVKSNQLTPNYILVLFIVSVLALAWAIFTLFSYHRSSTNAMFVAVIDLAFVGAFIAGVWYLRGIANADCTSANSSGRYTADFGAVGSITVGGYELNTDKPCAMLKASWAFGIMNCIFFFITAIAAWMHGGRMGKYDRGHGGGKSYYRETHTHRHGRRSGSRHSHHSRHSHRGYV